MKLALQIGILSLASSSLLSALPENFVIEKNPATPTQPLKLKFWGNPGFYYVIESTTDLTTSWDQYFYAIKGATGSGGTGQFEAVQFAPFVGTKMAFFKLKGDSDPFSLLALTDHDGDGIATALELDAAMNAVVAEAFTDSEPDGLPDYWEMFYFGDLTRDGEGDFDNDGILDKFEWQARTNPTVDDTAQGVLKDEFSYDDRGWLSGHQLMGSTETTLAHDAEGNVTEQN
jgi:hypothetical protein